MFMAEIYEVSVRSYSLIILCDSPSYKQDEVSAVNALGLVKLSQCIQGQESFFVQGAKLSCS